VTRFAKRADCIGLSVDDSDAIKTQLIALHSATHAFQETHDVKKLIEQVDE
jgi:hypothetical protein